MAGIGGRDGAAKLAILVNTPRMLRAADVFAEQASLQGVQVRVFVDAAEAIGWLYKGNSSALLVPDWPEAMPTEHPLAEHSQHIT